MRERTVYREIGRTEIRSGRKENRGRKEKGEGER
jgi:hypothetical protein